MKPAKVEARTERTVVREMQILNRFGIHARPASLFVKTAARFLSEITVEKDGAMVSGKSIMGLLTIEGRQGAILKITATGEDAAEAVSALEDLVLKKFFED